jgi:MarR family transcriptional regulator for hemolysin
LSGSHRNVGLLAEEVHIKDCLSLQLLSATLSLEPLDKEDDTNYNHHSYNDSEGTGMLFELEPHFRLVQLVAGIQIKTRQYAERRIRTLNMTYPQLGALMALCRKDRITQRELASLLETDTTTAMVLCDSLEKKGWLKRKRDATDRRANRLVVTAAGREAHNEALLLIQSGYEYVFGRTSPEEVERVLPVLESLYQRLKEVSPEGTKKGANL